MVSPHRYAAIAIASAIYLTTVGFLIVKSQPIEFQDLIGPAVAMDGDDLLLGDVDARLFGVDAPESDQWCEDARGQKYQCGEVSRKILADLVEGRLVTCKTVGKRLDGRPWVVCHIEDGTLVNAELVHAGAAVVYHRTPKVYALEEREAKAEMRGIWAGKFDPPHCFRRWKDKRLRASCASRPSVN